MLMAEWSTRCEWMYLAGESLEQELRIRSKNNGIHMMF